MQSDPASAHDELVEKMARAMAAKDSGPEGSVLFEIHWREFGEGYLSGAVAALAVARPVIKKECARVAEGPVYSTGGSGEVAIRGTDAGNWTVPQPV